jgi:hypothetical protein
VALHHSDSTRRGQSEACHLPVGGQNEQSVQRQQTRKGKVIRKEIAVQERREQNRSYESRVERRMESYRVE